LALVEVAVREAMCGCGMVSGARRIGTANEWGDVCEGGMGDAKPGEPNVVDSEPVIDEADADETAMVWGARRGPCCGRATVVLASSSSCSGAEMRKLVEWPSWRLEDGPGEVNKNETDGDWRRRCCNWARWEGVVAEVLLGVSERPRAGERYETR